MSYFSRFFIIIQKYIQKHYKIHTDQKTNKNKTKINNNIRTDEERGKIKK